MVSWRSPVLNSSVSAASAGQCPRHDNRIDAVGVGWPACVQNRHRSCVSPGGRRVISHLTSKALAAWPPQLSVHPCLVCCCLAAGPPHSYPAPDAVPQVTEIHGMFAADCQVPATAAAAQMAAAAAAAAAAGGHHHAHHQQQQGQGQQAPAGHAHGQQQQGQSVEQQQPHGHSDIQPQVTELHGLLGASAGTAAEAQLAAAAAAQGAAGAGTPGGGSFGTPAAGSTGGPVTTGDWRPPLPHVGQTTRGLAAAAAATAPPAGGGGGSTGNANGAGSSTPQGRPSGAGSSRAAGGFATPRSASGDAPQTPAAAAAGAAAGAGPHGDSRLQYSPPAVNFNPGQAGLLPAAADGSGAGHGMGSAAGSGASLEQQQQLAAAHGTASADGAAAQQHPGALSQLDQELAAHEQGEAGYPHPASPAVAVVQGCNSQLGQQQDGSQGTPQGSAGLGRVGSVPPPEVQPAVDGAAEVEGPPAAALAREEVVEQPTAAGEQEADGPAQPGGAAAQQPVDKPADSTMTSPAQCQHLEQHQQQQRKRPGVPGGQQDSSCQGASRKRQRSSFTNGHYLSGPNAAAAAAAAAGAGGGSSWQQQHWQQLSGLLEGAGQVGGRANSLRLSCGGGGGGNGGGGQEFSTQHGISSKVYGSMDAGFASGSKAEGSLSYGGLDGCCSIGNGMASVANGGGPAAGYAQDADQEYSQEVEHGDGDGVEQQAQHLGQLAAQSGSTGKPGSAVGGVGAAAGAGGAGGGASLQEGEGSHGSRSQEEGSRHKRRRRTSCEVASGQQQQQQRMASSMQTTEA